MAKKKNNGSGSVKKLPSGTWRGQVMDGYRSDGKKNIVNFTAPTKGEVQAMIRNYWYTRDNERPSDPIQEDCSHTMPFDQWADTWYDDYKSQVQPSTYCNYRYTLNVLKNYFGKQDITEIKPMDVNKFNDFMVDSAMSKSYITKCRAMLMQIMDAAEANDLISSNPARKSKSVRIFPSLDDNINSKKDAFTDTEQALLMEHLPDNMIGHTIRLMIGTGTRTQEVLALLESDIADDGSTISITKAIKMVDGGPVLGPPKSEKGKRIIPVPADYRKDALYLRSHSGKPYIWTSKRENGLYDIGSFRRRYYRVLKRIAGIRPLSPHCCRHTYITNLEKKGVPMEMIARLAGHSRITTTDGYIHIDIDTLSNVVTVLNKEM